MIETSGCRLTSAHCVRGNVSTARAAVGNSMASAPTNFRSPSPTSSSAKCVQPRIMADEHDMRMRGAGLSEHGKERRRLGEIQRIVGNELRRRRAEAREQQRDGRACADCARA